MAIRFNYADKKLTGVNKGQLKEMVQLIFKDEQFETASIDYIFCSDDYLLKINQQALQHDYYTDIITFPLSKPTEPIVAEIYISLDRVKENAILLNQTFKKELARVVAHGALHLCGYKDKKKADILKIRAKEDFYIKEF